MGGKLSKKRKMMKTRKKIEKELKKRDHAPELWRSTNKKIAAYSIYETHDEYDENYDADYSDDSDSFSEPEKCYDPRDPTLTFRDGEDDLDCVSSGLPERHARMEPDSDEESSSDDEESYRDSEKRYNPQDPVLKFENGDDDLDFECYDWSSLRARMSCGHAVTPMSLTLWCQRLLDEGEHKFVCGQMNCDVEWPFEEVCKMALLTPEEIEYFEKRMFCNAKEFLEVKECPGCKSLVARKDLNNLNVECSVCTAANNRVYRFCWQCLREWQGTDPRSDRCENNDCQSPLEILRTCPEIIFNDVKGVKGCPSIRACPTCGFLINHKGTQCKSIVCGRCKVKFCFVCLGFTNECLRGNPYGACPTGVAGRQTSIPVRTKN